MDAALDGSTIKIGRRPFASRSSNRVLELAAFTIFLTVNWLMAEQAPSPFFSYTSVGLFAWLVLLLIRIQPRAAILALPLIMTRGSALISLVFIEAGSVMPEVSRVGAPGDASASFVAFTAIFLLAYGLVFSAFERPVLANARSPLLDRMTTLVHLPIVGACAAFGILALLQGASTGFPIFEHIDRFYYRRFFGEGVVLLLLDNKTLITAVLGAVAFGRMTSSLMRISATATFAGLIVTFLLFGDKFFTILTATLYFLMPYLLKRDQVLLKTIAKGWLIAAALLAMAFGATLYIYSDYGAAPLDRAMTRLGDRIAGEGELWFVATQDDRRLAHYDSHLVSSYLASFDAPDPAVDALEKGVETYYFINRYAPETLRRSFHRNQGWVQLTMGYEAMGLTMFGYFGLVIVMIAGGIIAAVPALYLRRAFASEFPLSIALAVWTGLQAYGTLQQASFWSMFARGQLRRFLLFFTFEIVLFGFNRSQTFGRSAPATAAPTTPDLRSGQRV